MSQNHGENIDQQRAYFFSKSFKNTGKNNKSCLLSNIYLNTVIVFVNNNNVAFIINSNTRWSIEMARLRTRSTKHVTKTSIWIKNLYAVIAAVRDNEKTLELKKYKIKLVSKLRISLWSPQG